MLPRTCYSAVCDRDEEQGYFGPVPTLSVTERRGTRVFCRSNSVNSEQRSSTMGCEECSIKFTVFKRKKQCGVCQQYYCRDCLGHTDNNGSTTSLMARFSDKKLKCSRCKVLTARPLIRSELQQLRVKDLQQYLTSQHVSTRGCVEKDDLVNLLIRHVAVSSNRRETNPYSEPTFPGRAQPASTTAPPVSRSTPTQPAPSSNPLSSSPAHVGSESEAEYDVSSPTDSEVDSFVMVDGNVFLRAGVDLEITEMSETSGDGTLSDQGVEPLVTEVEELVENNTVDSLPIIDEDLVMSDLSESSRNKDLSIQIPTVMCLADISAPSELETLSSKQLKELLVRNRVDFRGCCEKPELVEKAARLWNENTQARKELEKLDMDELCKVCMDAPVECVMLECGHMATCTNCGKQLSECPICRQYVVRVVRIFKA
uniref:RING-type domain-containing protein n=1 Tax=Timema tahoe TaxID=61484 RepID=A0A7R9IIQ8_9NEOP|nr:unnamed protein product [Timema tahoe]